MKPAIRTDLAMEAREIAVQTHGKGEIPGVRFSAYEDMGLTIDVMDIETQEGADALCNRLGTMSPLRLESFCGEMTMPLRIPQKVLLRSWGKCWV